MSEPEPKTGKPNCPHCGANNTYRSRRIGPIEWFLHHVLMHSPYRCQDCNERFFHHRLARHSKEEDLHHHSAA